jgi:hypothetical protein
MLSGDQSIVFSMNLSNNISLPQDALKICVLSGHYPGRGIIDFQRNHIEYASHHGYCYINASFYCNVSNPFFNKIIYILNYLPYFDYIFWIDDDALFVDFKRPLNSLICDAELVICSSPKNKSIFTKISTGQFLIKRSNWSTRILNDIIKIDMTSVQRLFESRPDLGYFTNGDQDAMIYMLEMSYGYDRVFIHDSSAFNSRVEDMGSTNTVPFIVHLTGSWRKKIHDYRLLRNFSPFQMLRSDVCLIKLELSRMSKHLVSFARSYFV